MAREARRLSNKNPTRKTPAVLPRQVSSIGRNELCPCGSGKKYKDCHRNEGELFLQKMALRKEKERVREKRQRLKEAGVPWYKRLFIWA